MQLDQEKMEKFMSFLSEKWKGNKECPVCKNLLWTINDRIMELPEFAQESGIKKSKISHPVLPVVCGFCNYTLLFNVASLGLIDYLQQDSKINVQEPNNAK